ncbi:hypothetical protein N665_0027s0062 [Sinapis alba]|nr:hypothetical protein N665_0027s0062 [Sinapis alba]
MKNFHERDEDESDTRKSYKSTDTKRSKNMKRLGGGGLSLQTFANLKSKNSHYNPAFIKKQKEFYKNAKYVSKFRKSMKQQNVHEKEDEMKSFHGETSKVVDDKHKGKRMGVEEVYKQTREEMEKARREREEAFQAKKQAKEEAESRRKEAKGKMMRKTRHGQPVMKYRIEHLLESIKKSADNDGKNHMTSSC